MIKNRRGKKAQLLKELQDNPTIERACRKINISRATFYRWLKEDSQYKTEVEEAQEIGRGKITDFAESKLFENIQNSHFASIRFWLQHNTNRYSPKSTTFYSDEYYRYRNAMDKERELILKEYLDRLDTNELKKLALGPDFPTNDNTEKY